MATSTSTDTSGSPLPSVVFCPMCRAPSPTLKLYVSHLRLVHAKDPKFHIMCGVDSCREVFRTFSAFNSHVYRHHRTALTRDQSVVNETSEASESASSPLSIDDFFPEISSYDDEDEDPLVSLSANPPERDGMTARQHFQAVTSAKFVLELREGHQVPQVAISNVTSGCTTLCKQAVEEVKARVEAALASAAIDSETIPGLMDVLNYEPNPFAAIDTSYKFEKFCIENLGCLEAREVELGEARYVNRFSGTKRRKVSVSSKFYYVPVLDSLRTLLQLDDFLAEVLNPHAQSTDDQLGDFCDGSLFKTHPLFSEDPYALQVIPYYDELEVVNPIGSYIKKHKLGCLFFFLGNIRPQFRSTFKAIHLVAVARSTDIDTFGIDAFLLPFVEDLKILYCDGITVPVGGKECTFYGAVLAFLADTLAAHSLGGFKKSMSFALRVCRSCLSTTEQLKTILSEASCTLRTPESYLAQCSLLTGPLRDHYSTTYGINRMSILEELPGFSVINGLPHDIMHDLYEGIVPYELKLLICHCVQEGYFTIGELNQRIEAYDFGGNGPSDIDPKLANNPNVKIRQSASQMMVLSREFPFLIADKIPQHDENWKLFLLLLKICSISLSPVCTRDTIAYLRVLIEEKLEEFQRLYPGQSVIPKQHYMVHYPAQIERLGPLIHSWNMRQESKLSFVKTVSKRSNYKNVCKTVAKKHQFWLCHQIQSDPHLLIPKFEISKKFLSCSLNEEDDYVQREILRLIPGVPLDSCVQHPNWLDLQSSHLCKGVYVLLKYDLVRPTFGKLFDIACIEHTAILCVQEYYGHVFNSHYNAFEIATRGTILAVSVDTLDDHRPLSARQTFVSSDTSTFISLPYMC